MATITQTRSELLIQDGARSYSTTQCWEQFPGIVTVSHSGGKRGWRTQCKSPAGDPRQTTITTSVTATDDYITFDEVGQYQFVVKKQNCTASVRRSRSFKLVQREGETAQAPPASASETVRANPSTDVQAAPTRSRSEPPQQTCSGPPARLEVRPAEKLIQAGQSFVFRARVLDDSGCVLRLQPKWHRVDEHPYVELIGPGHVRVAVGAPASTTLLQASVGNKSVDVRLQVVSKERYDELLLTDTFDTRGESKAAAVAIITSGGIGAGKAVADERDQQRKLAVLAMLGALALALGMMGLILARRSKQARSAPPQRARPLRTPALQRAPDVHLVCPTCGQDYGSERSYCPRDGNRLIVAEPSMDPAQGGVCPSCGQGYNPGVERCPQHGEVLIPSSVYQSSRGGQVGATRKICPICGSQYPGDAEFCGRDGANLVPVN